MPITVHQPLLLTSQGRRPKNEDYLLASAGRSTERTPLVYIVCDGVGGHDNGAIASQLTAKVIEGELASTKSDSNIHGAVKLAHLAINDYIRSSDVTSSMATTLTLLFLKHDTATIAHVGDSRIYQMRGDRLLRKTKDHSLVQELLNHQLITPEQALNHPKRNVITRAITKDVSTVEPEILELRDLAAEDLFFLCTDGILEGFPNGELVTLLGRDDLSDSERMDVIESRCTERSHDNFSACLIRLASVDV